MYVCCAELLFSSSSGTHFLILGVVISFPELSIKHQLLQRCRGKWSPCTQEMKWNIKGQIKSRYWIINLNKCSNKMHFKCINEIIRMLKCRNKLHYRMYKNADKRPSMSSWMFVDVKESGIVRFYFPRAPPSLCLI